MLKHVYALILIAAANIANAEHACPSLDGNWAMTGESVLSGIPVYAVGEVVIADFNTDCVQPVFCGVGTARLFVSGGGLEDFDFSRFLITHLLDDCRFKGRIPSDGTTLKGVAVNANLLRVITTNAFDGESAKFTLERLQ